MPHYADVPHYAYLSHYAYVPRLVRGIHRPRGQAAGRRRSGQLSTRPGKIASILIKCIKTLLLFKDNGYNINIMFLRRNNLRWYDLALLSVIAGMDIVFLKNIMTIYKSACIKYCSFLAWRVTLLFSFPFRGSNSAC